MEILKIVIISTKLKGLTTYISSMDLFLRELRGRYGVVHSFDKKT